MKVIKHVALAIVCATAGCAFAEGYTAHSMLTRDGRRLVSRVEGTNTVYELVPTNRLPANLPPVREWKLYCLKATHTDIGLHNSQYIQRHGTVKRIDEAARLIDADARADDDPAAYRYVMEGFWFWDNYHQDKGMDAAWRIVTNYVARGRMDVGVTCAGNHTHLFSETEIERSTLTKRLLADKWGIGTRTFIMPDNPGISCSVIAPYARAGIRHGIFLPNQWNPIASTIWRKNTSITGAKHNPDAMGGGNRVEISYDSPLPMVFRWKAPGRDESLLMWCVTHYGYGYSRIGLGKKGTVDVVEKKMPAFLAILERKYPYDVWLGSEYHDDEMPNTRFADFAAEWNRKWAWPQFRTVGRLDEPFDCLEERFGDKIPTLTGEMTSGWLQHAASTPELLADKLNADRMLETAERLGTFAGTIDRAAVDRAWWYLILNDEHSYGVSGYRGRRVFETWMQRRDWIERAAATASNELAKAVAKLDLASSPPSLVQCRDGVTENRWYRVAVTNGVIYSIYDKELGRELLDGPANRFLYTRDNHKTWEADPEAALGAQVTRRVYLPQDAKRIDVEDRFEHARDLFNSRRYYRYGYLAFPFAVPDGAFAAHLNGVVVRPYEDCHPMTTDAYCAVRDWCAVENGAFGVALMMRDSTLTEFGEIHPDKTCYTGKPPAGKTGIYPYLFADWLQMHQPDGDSMNFTFRFAITSYANGDRGATALPGGAVKMVGRSPRDRRWTEISRICEDWLNPYAPWMRAHNVPRVARDTVAETPPGWTGLIEKPRAGHGEKDGQMYVLWGAEMSPDFSHYELYRDGTFLANVTNEVPDGIPYRVARYEDLGLPTHSRHEYRIRKVWKDGRKDALGEPFFGLTRHVGDDERNGVTCNGEHGWMDVRYDGATITGWGPAALGGQNALFMPKNTPWGKEVHGGVPICWPWFGRREGMPKHGLARYLKWRLVGNAGRTRVELETESTPETLKIWPRPFRLNVVFSLAGPDKLQISFTETNTGTKTFKSAFGIHPYFAVADACAVALDGERLPKPPVLKDIASDGNSHRLEDVVRGIAYTVRAPGKDGWYAWNPGVERTPLCETLDPEEWRKFFCLEPFIRAPRPLAPGKSRTHTLQVYVSKGAPDALTLEEGFKAPPNSAKPHTWYHMMNGNVTKEGITCDFEALAKAGIGGVQMFDAGCAIPPGPLAFNSPEWFDMFRHAASEARRLGLEICIPNCSGWSSSGGPWNMPSNGMKKVVATETRVKGPVAFRGKLPRVEEDNGFYEDIAVLAFPTPPADLTTFDGVKSTLDGRKATLSSDRPFTAQGFSMRLSFPSVKKAAAEVTVETSADGADFTTLETFTVTLAKSGVRYAVPSRHHFARPVTARAIRVTFASKHPLTVEELSPEAGLRIDELRPKMFDFRSRVQRDATVARPDQLVRGDGIADLTERLSPDGTLAWDAPAGDWTVLRIGYVCNGRCNHPASAHGKGLEVDKLSASAVDYHFDQYVARLCRHLGPLAGDVASGFNNILVDSYEVGSQNWTQGFAQAFEKRAGYPIAKWLPVLAGYVVDSVDASERFLEDFRRVIADLFAENYAGRLAELCHRHGLKLSVEPYGNCPSDDLQYGQDVDIPMGEFWSAARKGNHGTATGNAKFPANLAHVWGRRYAAAESFTAGPPVGGRWQTTPFAIKAQGDRVFARGINRIIYHRFTHQPWPGNKYLPGMTMGRWGMHLDRTQTWWHLAGDWFRYQARCQWMLQEGTFVADVLYFCGEQAPNSGHAAEGDAVKDMELPPGYDWDVCAAKAMEMLKVVDGRVVVPGGVSYALLALPPQETMSERMLEVVERLVDAGAKVCALRKPTRAPGLAGYPAADGRVRALADRVWAKGVMACRPAEALERLGVAPDFTSTETDPQKGAVYIHRRADARERVPPADWYFVALNNVRSKSFEASFRVTGLQPEIWDAETGTVADAPLWRAEKGRTVVTLDFPPSGSAFVVFRRPVAGDHVESVSVRAQRRPKPTPAAAEERFPVTVRKAVYGVFDETGAPVKGLSMDVTSALSARIKGGRLSAVIDNRLAGRDPARGRRKSARVTYAFRGVEKTVTVKEHARLSVPPRTGAPDPASAPVVAVKVPWRVKFPVDWYTGGTAVKELSLAALADWTAQADPDIRYFSGTATYSAQVPFSPKAGERTILDLGEVRNFAVVTVNGKTFPALWRPPYRVDITEALRTGTTSVSPVGNGTFDLEIKVTNLWPNRLIGDDFLKADCAWRGAVRRGVKEIGVKEIPQWVKEGGRSPTGRHTFTTWKHWSKEDAPLASGLLGPVVLRPAVIARDVRLQQRLPFDMKAARGLAFGEAFAPKGRD